MNLNEVQNAFGRQSPGGNNPGGKQSSNALLTLVLVSVGIYLAYKFIDRDKDDNPKINKP